MAGFRPQRIQRRQTKGWRASGETVYVGRPTKWGNPFKKGDLISLGGGFTDDPVLAFRILVTNHGAWPYQKEAREELGGKDLACWCPLCPTHSEGKPLGVECSACEPCHADELLAIANLTRMRRGWPEERLLEIANA